MSKSAPSMVVPKAGNRNACFGLAAQVTIVPVICILLLGVCVTGVAKYLLDRGATEAAQERVETNMRIAWEVIRAQGNSFSVSGDNLLVGDHVLNGNAALVDKVKSLVGGTCTIFLNDLRIATNVMKPDGSRATGTRLARSDAYAAIFERKAPYRGQVQILDEPYMTAYDPIFGANGELLGILYVGLKKAEFLKSANDTLLMIIGTTLLTALVAVAASCFLARNNIVRPLRSSVDTMKRLARGDLSAATPAAKRNDEIGEISSALAVFKQTLIAKEAADQAAAIEAASKIERAHRIDALTHEFEDLIGEVIETVSSASNRLEGSAGALTKTAARAQELTTTVAATSEQASANVQSVASATEEMSQSIGEISRHVHESARIASEAVQRANDTNARVGELAQAAARIGDVVELISTIAGQTNLLALNATIEAARAQEAGRGFAVVASEVKQLAGQTAKATDEIGQQIAGIQTATQESVGAIQEIGDIIRRMSEISATIALAVEQQGQAAQDISRNVQQAAMGTQQVTNNIADVQHGADETGSTSVEVHTAAQLLSRDSLRLKREVDRFMNAVRAA